MKREPFDRELEEMFKKKAEPVRMTGAEEDRMFSRILDRVGEPGQKEDSAMFRRFTGRKVFVAAAAMCLIGAFGAVAAGRIVSVTSSVRVDQPDYRTAAEVAAAADQMGFVPKAVDEFSNGYRFSNGYFVTLKGVDETQTTVTENPSVMVDYQKGNERATLTIESPMAGMGQESETELTKEYEGITLNYFQTDSLFVDVNYELTEEEKALQAAGDLNVAYGLPEGEREEVTNQFVTWSDGGGNYSLMVEDTAGLTADEMFGMAEEIIGSSAAVK